MNNRISEVNGDGFNPHMVTLKVLEMQSNLLTKVTRDMFKHLPAIRHLDLGNNRITAVEKDAFFERLQSVPDPKEFKVNLAGNDPALCCDHPTRQYILDTLLPYLTREDICQFGPGEPTTIVPGYVSPWCPPEGSHKYGVWTLAGGTAKQSERFINNLPTALAMSSGGGVVAAGTYHGVVQLYDTATDDAAKTHRVDANDKAVLAVATNHEGNRIAAGTQGGKLLVLDTLTVDNKPPPGSGAAMSFHQGSAIVSLSMDGSGDLLATGDAAGRVGIWDMREHGTRWHNRVVVTQLNPSSPVAFSPDDRKILTGYNDNTVRLWDSTGTLIQTFSGHWQPARSVAFSPDGSKIVTGALDFTVRLWDVSSGNLIKTLQHDGYAHSVAFSPDGSTFVSAGAGQKVRLWNASTGENIYDAGTTGSTLYAVAFSPDGRNIVSGGEDGKIRIYSASTGAEVGTHNEHTGVVWSVAFSADGSRIASGDGDGVIMLRDHDGVYEKSLVGHGQPVNSLAFSPDSQRIVSGGGDDTARLWDVSTGANTNILRGHTNDVTSVAFSPDGREIVSGSADFTARLWDLAHGDIVRNHHYPGEGGICNVTLAADGELAMISTRAGRVVIIDPLDDTWSSPVVDYTSHNAEIFSAHMSANKERVALVIGNDLEVWSTIGPHITVRATVEATNCGSDPDCIPAIREMSTNENLIIDSEGGDMTSDIFTGAASNDNSVWVYVAGTPTSWKVRVKTLADDRVLYESTPSGFSGSVVMSGDGRYMVLGRQVGDFSYISLLDAWNVGPDRLSNVFIRPTVTIADTHMMAAISSDGSRMVGVASRSFVQVFRTHDQSRVHNISAPSPAKVHSVALNPNGTMLALGLSVSTVRLYNSVGFMTGQLEVGPNDDPVIDMAFSKDGARLAAADDQGRIQVFDLVSLENAHSLPQLSTGEVGVVSLSADGTLLAVGSSGGSAQLWNLTAETQLWNTTNFHNGEGIKFVSLSDDGSVLLACTQSTCKTYGWQAAPDPDETCHAAPHAPPGRHRRAAADTPLVEEIVSSRDYMCIS